LTTERTIADRSGRLRTPPRELQNLPLEDAQQLVHLYAERGSPKFETAMRWLERYLASRES